MASQLRYNVRLLPLLQSSFFNGFCAHDPTPISP